MLARWDEPEIVGILEMNSDLSKIADMHMNQLLSHSFCRYTKGVVGNFFFKSSHDNTEALGSQYAPSFFS